MDGDAELLAAFDVDTGEFVDLLKATAGELYFRSPHETWEVYPPNDFSLDGKDILDVDESFIKVTDKAFAAKSVPARDEAVKHMADDGMEATR